MVSIRQGKGRVDRQVMLSVSFELLLRQLSKAFQLGVFVFPGQRSGRYPSLSGAEAKGAVGVGARSPRELPPIDAMAAFGLGRGLCIRPALLISEP